MPRAFQVLWMGTAEADLRSIAADLARESPAAAAGALDLIEEKASGLARFPERGRVVPELSAHAVLAYRELVIAPWRVVYRVEARRVLVLAVLDARRNLEDLLLDRFLR
ncbi:MAG: type II toxin-antitoxin system RelE/ParE family toxin [Elusimicrobia bacterium]|nr:type II toxin-antitoxin system RelE/ParE family toxin [Elusimicrobiota bacterium]